MAMSPDEPNIIYTAVYTNPCLIYRTSNGGAGWDLVSSINAYVNCLAVNPHLPNVVYASTWSEYVYRSTDGGGTWTGFQTNHTGNYVYALLEDPADPDVLWGAADMHVGSYAHVAAAQSTDGGSTWTFYPLSPPGWGAAYSIAIPPENPLTIYVGGYYYEPGDLRPHVAIYKSTDGGVHWQDVGSDIDSLRAEGHVFALAVRTTDRESVYAGGYYWDEHAEDFYLFKSTDGGEHWTPTGSGISSPIYSFVLHPSVFSTAYAATGETVFKSVDGGITWTPSGPGMFGQHARCLLLNPVNPSTVYAGNQAGVFKTVDGARHWSFSSTGIAATRVCALATASSSPHTLYVGVEDDALYRSTDDGMNWNRLHEFSGCHGVEALAIDPQDVDKIYLFTGG